MREDEIIVTTRHGRMPTFAAAPDGGGEHPGIIFYMDAPGIREELRNMARRIARHGYVCLLPDMYYRLGTVRFDIPRRDDGMSGVIRASMNSLSIAGVNDDTAAMLAWFDANEQVKIGAIGCVGHCMSGPFAMTVAANYSRMRAAAALYGVDMVTDKPDSPHRLASRIQGELYIGFAEHDPAVPPGVAPALGKALEEAGTRYRMETYQGAHHGFCFANRPDYDASAAERCWDTLFDFWARNLK